MARLYLVRHGEAAAGWNEDPDPPLSDLGRRQAEQVADELARLAGSAAPLPLMTSPMLRCRETSAALSSLWKVEPVVEPAMTELHSPGQDLEARGRWLRRVMQGTWDEMLADPETGDPAPLKLQHSDIKKTLLSQESDIVVFSHFIAINVAVGAATGDDRVVCFRPANCSVTVLETDGSALRLVSTGQEAETKVN